MKIFFIKCVFMLAALIFLSPSFKVSAQNIIKESDKIDVEPLYMIPIKTFGKIKSEGYKLLSYKDRRSTWTSTLSISYNQFRPKNYQINGLDNSNFDEVFPKKVNPLLNFGFSLKRNFLLGAFGVEMGVGHVKYSSTLEGSARLSASFLHMGLNYTLDNIWTEPIIAPYVAAGGYIVNYKEEVFSQTEAELTKKIFKGNTKPTGYLKAGLAFQLDWVDDDAATKSYINSDIENIFLYIEAKKFLISTDVKDPDFSSLYAALGLLIEF